MKKIIMAVALATTALVSINSASAGVTTKQIEEAREIGNSAVCNTLDKGVMYNPTELSEHTKCWLSVHQADEEFGTQGGIFWVRANGDYVSMRTQDLVNAGSKNAAKDVFMEKVKDEVMKDYQDRVVGVAQEVHDAIVADRDRLIGELTTATADAAAKAAEIVTLATDANKVRDALVAARRAAETTEEAVASINALRTELSDARFVNANRDRLIAAAQRKAVAIAGYSDAELFQNQSRGVNYETTHAGIAAGQAANDLDAKLNQGFLAGQYRVEIIAGESFTIANLEGLDRALEQAFDEGYAAGFDDGYEAGYADGYRDGYADGASDAAGN